MKQKRRLTLPWRAGVAALAILSASTMASAQSRTNVLQLPEWNPAIEFGGTVSYDGASALKIQGNTMYTTLTNEIVAIIVISGQSPIAPTVTADGRHFCAQSPTDANQDSLFAARVGGVFQCFHDGGWAPLQYTAGAVSSATFPFDPPKFSDAALSADACGVVNGTDNLCVRGTVVRCLNGPTVNDAHGCTGQIPGTTAAGNDWELVTAAGVVNNVVNPPVLLSARTVNGLRSQVIGAKHFTSLFFDQVEVVALVSPGGLLAGAYPTVCAGSTDPACVDTRKIVTIDAPLMPGTHNADALWNWTQSFAQPVHSSFTAHIYATNGNDGTSGLFPSDKCNGQINGTVLNGLTAAGIADTTITVHGGDLLAAEQRTTLANGLYAVSSSALHATGLCAGIYTVRAASPLGYVDAATDGFPSTVTVTLTASAAGDDTSSTVNFKFYPAVSTDFVTFGQGEWGAKPNPRIQNAGYILNTFYSVPYGTGNVVIGGAFTVTMTGALAVQNFLPQNGRPMPLDANYIDFTNPILKFGWRRYHTRLGSLAGETLALRLNVDFSATGLTKAGLGGLFVTTGAFKGKTVNDVLTLANSVLGGGPLPAGMKYDTVEDAAEAINRNYQGGRNRGYLSVTKVP